MNIVESIHQYIKDNPGCASTQIKEPMGFKELNTVWGALNSLARSGQIYSTGSLNKRKWFSADIEINYTHKKVLGMPWLLT